LLDLKANPSFGELQEIRAFCSRYLDEDGLSSKEDEDDTDEGDILPEGLTRDHFKDQEMADRAGAWAKEFDGIMTFLEAASKGKTAPYPRKTPRFEGPKELISYFKARWEKLKCRYC
jgi:hypothetical protein